MSYVIQITKPRDQHNLKFWGGNTGPFKDPRHPDVETYRTFAQAEADAGRFLKACIVRILTREKAIRLYLRANPPVKKPRERFMGFDFNHNPLFGDKIFMMHKPRMDFWKGTENMTYSPGEPSIHSGLTMDKIDAVLKDAMAAKPALRGYTSAERKAMPVQTVIAEYFPDAIAALARHSKKANDKHNPGEPMHWARDKSTDHLNCAGRHLLTPDAVDPDTGETEAVCLLWRAAAYVQLQEEKRLKAAGIKPLSGVVPKDGPKLAPCGCPEDAFSCNH